MFCTIAAFSLYGDESTSYVFSFRMVFSYLVATGWIFHIRSAYLCENSINQSINQNHESFSREKLRQEPQKKEGGEVLHDLPPA